MKIVLFNDNLDVIQVIGSAENIVADGKNVSWEGGEIRGITGDFLILNDEVEVSYISSFEELEPLDKKEQFQNVDLEQENKELKNRLEAAELAIIDLLDYL